ncbi:zinc ribbon domain-containing protein [Clostridium tertium]
MNKCPRCENEKLREDQNFCQICGIKLNMNKENAIISLKKLADENKLLYPHERQAIEYAIKELERTAQEVPVQEQSKFIPEDSNGICKNRIALCTPNNF